MDSSCGSTHTIIASIERCGDVIVLIGAINLRWMDSCMHRRGMQDDIPVGDWYDFTIIHASSFQNFAGLGSERFFSLRCLPSRHGDRLLSTWLRMEIITHSGTVTLIVGRDGEKEIDLQRFLWGIVPRDAFHDCHPYRCTSVVQSGQNQKLRASVDHYRGSIRGWSRMTRVMSRLVLKTIAIFRISIS